MIVEKLHHRHRGTHDAAALMEWLAAMTWLPVSIDAVRSDLEANGQEEAFFLPRPVPTWVCGTDRISAASVEREWWGGPDRLTKAGWEKVYLFDLGEVVRKFRNLGYRCRGCRQVYPFREAAWDAPLVEFPHEYQPEAEALCCFCADAADQCAKKKPRAVERAIRMPLAVEHARDAMKRINRISPKRIPASVRQELEAIGDLIGEPYTATRKTRTPVVG